METMKLWNSVEKTNPAHTKKAKIGQMNITAICPQDQRKKATSLFGPYGHGWGVKDDKYEFIDFADNTKLCTYTATLWYVYGDMEGDFPIQSNIKVAFITNGGKGYLKIDDEYAKKAATDALTKGLSMLGFNSDVFEGRYDDNKYVNQMKDEFTEKVEPRKHTEKEVQEFITNMQKHELWELLTKEEQDSYINNPTDAMQKALKVLGAKKKKEAK